MPTEPTNNDSAALRDMRQLVRFIAVAIAIAAIVVVVLVISHTHSALGSRASTVSGN